MRMQQQQGQEDVLIKAVDIQVRKWLEIPLQRERAQALEARLRRSRELITRVNQERPCANWSAQES